MPAGITTLTAADYRNPDQLPDGGVLVVGASASGVQIADELQRSGRPVTLAVGEHVRMPRTYRGRDILWWMDASGVLDERYDEVADLVRARNLPSMQLVGSPERRDARPERARPLGVRLVGRLAGDPRRHGAVLRLAAQRVRAGRPEAGPAAGHHRRVGRPGRDRRRAAAAAVRADRGPAPVRCRLDLRRRRDRDDRLGHRLPAGAVLARRPGARPQGPASSTTAASRAAPACT